MVNVFDLIEMSINSTNPTTRGRLDTAIRDLSPEGSKVLLREAVTLLAALSAVAALQINQDVMHVIDKLHDAASEGEG